LLYWYKSTNTDAKGAARSRIASGGGVSSVGGRRVAYSSASTAAAAAAAAIAATVAATAAAVRELRGSLRPHTHTSS
jgi:hypothetical protein